MTIKTIPTLCGSAAANPSGLGVKLHNAGYQAAGLDYTYVAMGVDDIDSALSVCKSMQFRGLGVSMPHKQTVISRLDVVSPDVKEIGACNTIVFEDGKLLGHNTDWMGARDSLVEVGAGKPRRAVIVGTGGVARAIGYAIKQMGAEVYVVGRSEEKAQELASQLALNGYGNLADQGKFDADLLVNATPEAHSDGPLKLADHPNATALLDVVFNEITTALAQEAIEKDLKVAPGWRMLLHQAVGQFRLYTGTEPDIEKMGSVLEAAFA